MGIEILQNKEEIFNRLKKRSEVNPITNCWLWIGALNNTTYGHGVIKLWKKGPNYYVHRLSAYIYYNYNLDNKELQINHFCSNSNCWNPNHIYIGTQTDNVRDSIEFGTHYEGKYKNVTHCIHGHEFTEENTYVYQRDNKIERSCKKCRALNAVKHRNPINPQNEDSE